MRLFDLRNASSKIPPIHRMMYEASLIITFVYDVLGDSWGNKVHLRFFCYDKIKFSRKGARRACKDHGGRKIAINQKCRICNSYHVYSTRERVNLAEYLKGELVKAHQETKAEIERESKQ